LLRAMLRRAKPSKMTSGMQDAASNHSEASCCAASLYACDPRGGPCGRGPGMARDERYKG
jgi:hypothetical protein